MVSVGRERTSYLRRARWAARTGRPAPGTTNGPSRAGTNDLTQYTLAAERGYPAVAALSDPLDPGVLQLIDRVCQAALGRVDVAVCGESAADDAVIPVLVGLGVRELSVGPHDVPRVKARVRELDVDVCQVTAKQTLTLDSAADVRELVATKLGALPPT